MQPEDAFTKKPTEDYYAPRQYRLCDTSYKAHTDHPNDEEPSKRSHNETDVRKPN